MLYRALAKQVNERSRPNRKQESASYDLPAVKTSRLRQPIQHSTDLVDLKLDVGLSGSSKAPPIQNGVQNKSDVLCYVARRGMKAFATACMHLALAV